MSKHGNHWDIETHEAFDKLAEGVNAFGVSVIEVLASLGIQAMWAPDNELVTITDVPAIEYPDGRKYREDGTTW